jgi:hypothetical protein
LKKQNENLAGLRTQKEDLSSETWESLGLTWLREETDRATEMMLKIFKEQSANKSVKEK